ncbi:MAG: hypothetical protein RR855_04200 [Comamonas sp.]
MTRCSSVFSTAALACALLVGVAAPAAHAQGYPAGTRSFPDTAQRGELQISAMPEVTLNGKKIRTTPGFRLFNAKNQLVFAHTLQGQKFTVNYVIEPSTQWLHQAWILTPEEAKTKLPNQR